MKRGVCKERTHAAAACDENAADRQRVTQVAEVDELAGCFRGHGCHFVTQTQIQRQAAVKAPVILHVTSDDTLTKITSGGAAWNAPCEFLRIIGKKRRQVLERPDAIGIAVCGDFEQHALISRAELNGMLALGPESVVISLK